MKKILIFITFVLLISSFYKASAHFSDGFDMMGESNDESTNSLKVQRSTIGDRMMGGFNMHKYSSIGGMYAGVGGFYTVYILHALFIAVVFVDLILLGVFLWNKSKKE